ncbi:MAG: metallophosphoesterase [Fibrobacteria bacterium]|nr:metallophosphoesterase [Fibrobacteria bacterium]
MKIFALSDPHLAFSVPDKVMNCFGDVWIDHFRKIQMFWERLVSKDDIVIITGDISWAKKVEQAIDDLHWLHCLPGKKVIVRGNHDFWWSSTRKMKYQLPSSLNMVHNNCVQMGKVVFFGTRLWDTEEYNCDDIVDWDPRKCRIQEKKKGEKLEQQEKIYNRELERLKLSIKTLPKSDDVLKIGLCHFPPLDHKLNPSRASALFESAGAKHVVFGHLHSLFNTNGYFGKLDGVEYHLTSGDYLRFRPKLIAEVED